MHILILGAAGMVGRKLTERLLRDGRLGKNDITRMTLQDVVAPTKPAAPFAWGADTMPQVLPFQCSVSGRFWLSKRASQSRSSTRFRRRALSSATRTMVSR